MFCDECRERPASVHITKIVNGEKTQVRLCKDCAAKYQQQLGFGITPDFSFHKFLAGILDSDSFEGPIGTGYRKKLECEQCGLSYSQFRDTGRLGCDKCYETFSEKLDPVLRRIHGSIRHTGKVPKRAGGSLRIKQEIQRLRNELQELVSKEEFEKAAQVRDTIRDLEQKLSH